MADPAEALGLEKQPLHSYVVSEGRWPLFPSDRQWRIAVTVGAVALGFVMAAGLVASRQAAIQADARREELVGLVHVRQEYVDALTSQLEDVRARVAEAEARAAAGVPALAAQVREVEAAAGLSALSGPGVRVTMSDGSGLCSTGRPEDCRIQDADLQLAVNTLFALGAEGIAINGERLVATTAIRNAGGAVLVNYRVLASPYVIEAVGQAGALQAGFTDSSLAADFAVWKDTYGLGLTIETAETIQLPAFSGSTRLRSARVAEQEGGSDS